MTADVAEPELAAHALFHREQQRTQATVYSQPSAGGGLAPSHAAAPILRAKYTAFAVSFSEPETAAEKLAVRVLQPRQAVGFVNTAHFLLSFYI